MTKPVFVLGVGAQKAGTRFIYHALRQSQEVALSNPKEMHVFDARFIPEFGGEFHERRKRAAIEKLQRPDASASLSRRNNMKHILRHVAMHYDLGEYVSYFRELADSAPVVGEITPAYSMLGADHFETIRELLEPHFRVRPIFIMRDPVERVFSALRMTDRNQGRQRRFAHERFDRDFAKTGNAQRTQYDRTIRSLESIFRQDEIFYGFYEDMFRQTFFDRLCDFLGIRSIHPDFGTRSNQSPREVDLPQASAARARQHYADVYDFVRARFGKEYIHSIWPYARMEGAAQ